MSSKWVEIFEQTYGELVPNEQFFYLQEWLAVQDTDESGCPLIDQPFIFDIGDEDDIL
jgi:hypothetical protein